MKIAITGARGFIGGHLASHLSRKGHEVVGLGRGICGDDFGEIDPASGLLIADSSKDFSKHIAETEILILLGGKRQSPQANLLSEFLKANVIQMEKMVLTSIEAGVKKIIFASSIVACPLTSPVPYVETCQEFPDTMYGISKRLAEFVLNKHSKTGNYTGISLRLAQVFGANPNGRGALFSFINQAENNEPLQIHGEGRALRDYIYLKDVLNAFESAIVADIESNIYNIGSGCGYTIRELAETANQVYAQNPRPIQSVPVANEDRSKYVMDCSKALQDLNWKPQWSLKDALTDMRNP